MEPQGARDSDVSQPGAESKSPVAPTEPPVPPNELESTSTEPTNPPFIPMENVSRVYWARYAHAVQLYDQGDRETANELCKELVNDFVCPFLVQIQALQLQSLCAPNYWRSKEHLERAMDMLEEVEEENEVIQRYHHDTETMLYSMMGEFDFTWDRSGLSPPARPEDLVDGIHTAWGWLAVPGDAAEDEGGDELGVEQQLSVDASTGDVQHGSPSDGAEEEDEEDEGEL